jgi:hypothetical protein
LRPHLTLFPSDYPLIKVPQSRVHLFKMSMCVRLFDGCCGCDGHTAFELNDSFQVNAAAPVAISSSHERPCFGFTGALRLEPNRI